MKKLSLCLLSLLVFLPAFAADKDTRCYELRTYYAAPGKLEDLIARFRNHTVKLFEKHGISNVGYWVPEPNPDNKLIYMVAHPSREGAKENWKKFSSDPDWKAAAKASQVNGKLLTTIESVFMTPTDYSPKAQPSASGDPRLYELRTYKAPAGKLGDLNARFRNHTTKLFDKHGIAQLAYWTPMDADQGAEDTLIYIVMHKSREAADASWKAFRADPVWVEAKKASEVNGPLTSKVESVYMKPTDFSPAK